MPKKNFSETLNLMRVVLLFYSKATSLGRDKVPSSKIDIKLSRTYEKLYF